MEAGSGGVNLFFVLSGYFIFVSLQNNEQKKGSVLKWYGARMLRILPAYYTVIIGYFILYVIILKSVPIDETGLGWIRYLLCINQIVPAGDAFWSNLGATWTINVFLFFYLLAPFLFCIIRKMSDAGIALIVSYLLSRIADAHFNMWFRPVVYLYYFVIGIMVYYAVNEKKEKQFTIMGILLLFILTVLDSGGGLKLGILTGILMVVTEDMTCGRKQLSIIVSRFSEYTYVIYLAHYLVLVGITELTNLQGIGLITVFAVGTYVVSWGIHRCVELPAKNLLR